VVFEMFRSLRVYSSIAFGVAAASLALPFVEVKDNTAENTFEVLWQGLDFVVGGRFSVHASTLMPDGQGGYALQPVPGDVISQWLGPKLPVVVARPAFIVVAVVLLAGLLAPVLAGLRAPRAVAAVAGFAGAAALAAGEAAALVQLAPTTPGLRPTTAYGFWIVLAVLVAVGAANLITLRRLRRRPSDDPAGRIPLWTRSGRIQ
jgi:hypothetical protein